MSRCFPFPPPGYEKKARTDEGDNLPKEKQKEKKHKKDKDKDKDKEKKEKKDKERSKDKRKEKNDRKEKHKDKKKDKDKDKDKSKTSDEKRNEGRHKGYNGEKIEQNSLRAEEIKDFKFVQELGRRIRDAEKGSGIQMLENFTGTAQRKVEGMVRFVENVVDNRSEVTEKNKVGTDKKRAEVGMARLVDKDVSNRAEGKEKSTDCIDQRRDEGMARVVENAVNWAEGKEKNKEKNNDNRKADVQRNRQEERSVGNAKFHNFTSMDQQRVEGMGKPMDKDAEKRLEGKEKKKDKEGSDKHKERGPEKKSKAKDKDRSKEKEKEKAKEKSDNKNREQYKLKDSIKDPANTISIKTSTSKFSKESDKSCDADGNLGKRKDREMNGFLHGSDIRPNKLPKPGSSSHLLTENGKRVEPCLPSMQFTLDKQGISSKTENKECKVNGIIEAQLASVCPTKELPTAQANENGEASTKTPHPDMKYLNQILSVPKMEEWSEFDDQEWLFSSDSLQSKKPKVVGSSVVDEIPQVWAEALRMESADVCALPYVIPY